MAFIKELYNLSTYIWKNNTIYLYVKLIIVFKDITFLIIHLYKLIILNHLFLMYY